MTDQASFFLKKAFFSGAFFCLIGCATYQTKVDSARELLRNGNSSAALDILRPLAEEKNGDQLVYLLDYGTALSIAGQFEKSNQVLLQAAQLIEEVDYLSVSRFAGSLALSEEMVQYRGDTFEKIFVHALLAFNFLSLDQRDSALVEARRINEKLQKYRNDQKVEDFKKVEFGNYLAGHIWEASGNFDSAYISFETTYKMNPSYPGIEMDLIRLSRKARRSESYQKWKKLYPGIEEDPNWYDPKSANLVVIFQQGWGPRKQADPYERRFPMLRKVSSQIQACQIEIGQEVIGTSNLSYSVADAAIDTLKEDRSALLAKKVAGYATKEVLSDQLRQKDEALGAVANLLMHISDRADVRQWSTMPESIHIYRKSLKPQDAKVTLRGIDQFNQVTGEVREFESLSFKPGQTRFLVWRSLQ